MCTKGSSQGIDNVRILPTIKRRDQLTPLGASGSHYACQRSRYTATHRGQRDRLWFRGPTRGGGGDSPRLRGAVHPPSASRLAWTEFWLEASGEEGTWSTRSAQAARLAYLQYRTSPQMPLICNQLAKFIEQEDEDGSRAALTGGCRCGRLGSTTGLGTFAEGASPRWSARHTGRGVRGFPPPGCTRSTG
jgi:hypothetical protein